MKKKILEESFIIILKEKNKNIILLFGMFLSLSGVAQWISDEEYGRIFVPSEVIYHPFNDGIQLIEIDTLTAWEKALSDLSDLHPRSAPWSNTFPSPSVNPIVFRDTSGVIVAQFNRWNKLLEPPNFLTVDQYKKTFDTAKTQNAEVFFMPPPSAHLPSFRHVMNKKCRIEYDAHPNGYRTIVSDTLFEIKRWVSEDVYFTQGRERRIGLVDKKGSVILPAIYQMIQSYQSVFLLKKGNIHLITDNNFQVIGIVPYKWAFFDCYNYIRVKSNEGPLWPLRIVGFDWKRDLASHL